MTIQEKQSLSIPQVEPRYPIPPQNLRLPGPTPVPPHILAAQAQPMINHRGPEFIAMMHRITPRLQYFFQTSSPVLTYLASGTGGQECSIVNVFSPGDHVVVITGGALGNRFAQIAEIHGLNLTRIEIPWGEAIDPARVEERLTTLPPYKGVLITHNETSTGVTEDIQTLAAVIRRVSPEALIVVDAVSSLSCVPVEMDQWDLDVVFTSSQKGWMIPPGIMMIAASERAWEAYKTAKFPRFYFDWGGARKNLELGQHQTTPPVSLFYALDESLEMMLKEGKDAIFARHQKIGAYVRQRIKAMGLKLLADHAYASNTVTAVLVPEGIDVNALFQKLLEEDHIVFGSGPGKLNGKIFRIGHLGYVHEPEIAAALDTLEQRLHEFGFQR